MHAIKMFRRVFNKMRIVNYKVPIFFSKNHFAKGITIALFKQSK